MIRPSPTSTVDPARAKSHDRRTGQCRQFLRLDERARMAYWIFNFNPKKYYRLLDRLAAPKPTMTYTVRRYRHEIKPGDLVFFWETGENRGIRAVFRVDEAPRDMPEWE